ncbi:hypothetical protein EPA93_03415 [Ktedonosporobacter rubrisoli]|uniref:PRC-barrel domain-containing protein n=1 Tax=Ktedonosporobacter rubrisoli TaxID=2509675 RepID=A0A4P6JJI7_KTERU|nr:PRC-barrel domain-containing protein [Ktedonosporobacter rubrisoli]QBD75092.1 hypothetical protein EPA93_03415 [Ktedonosporobacter rubrisoli]
MQNNAAETRKWSEIKGLAAVSIDTGTKMGTINDFYFDEQSNTIRAFLIKTGLFGHRVLLASSIHSVGADAITFAHENMLIKEGDKKELSTLVMGHSLLAFRVLSESGNVVGTVGNILLDTSTPATMRIISFEMAGGLLENISKRFSVFAADQVTRYGQDVIVISDAAAQDLNKGKS